MKKNIKKYPIILFVLLTSTIILVKYNKNQQQKILSNYNYSVITIKEATLYSKKNKLYQKIGTVEKNVVLTLNKKIDYKNKLFNAKINNDNYYIYYDDVKKINYKSKSSKRYKKYILFNENIITKNKFTLFDEDNNKVFELNKSISFPIIIKESNKYGVEFENQLFFIKKEDVLNTINKHNTDILNTPKIGVLNYHFFWDDDIENKNVCNQIICHSKTEFKKHLDLIKKMNLLTINMKELEMYIDGKIQLPPSIVITIDDGWRAELGIKILNEYQMNGTLFLITGSYDPNGYKTKNNKYVEIHSHTNKLHDPGLCPGGQGSGLKCLPKKQIINDLNESREKLNGSEVLCYPFYEYNDYTILLVKEAGFKMAFAGENNINNNYVIVGSDKFRLPRFVISTTTTINDLIEYFQ